MTFLVVFAIVLVLWGIADFYMRNRGRRSSRLRLPFLGDLLTVIKEFDRFHDFALDEFQRAGDNVALPIQLVPYTVHGIVDPSDVRHVLRDKWENYVVSQGLRGEAMRDVFGDGIFNADGQHWFLQRKAASREFSANIFRNFMSHEFVGYARALLERLTTIASAQPSPATGRSPTTSRSPTMPATAAGLSGSGPSATFDMHDEFYKLTLDSFGKVAFGIDLGLVAGRPNPFARSFDESQVILSRRIAERPPFVWKTMRYLNIGDERRLRQHLVTINSFLDHLIGERRAQGVDGEGGTERDDLLSKLLSVSGSDKVCSSNKYLRDMIVNFIIAGRDTTACALSWLLYRVATTPHAEQRLLDELDVVMGGRLPSFDDFTDCHFLTATIHETLRLHPSVPFDPKTAVEDDVLPTGGAVRAGDSVAYMPYAMGRLESIWGPDAAEFKPERWLDEATGQFVRADPFKHPVFQAGPRMCLGVDMAQLEMKIVVATLLPRLRFEVLETPTYRTGVVLQMMHGLQCRVSPRQ